MNQITKLLGIAIMVAFVGTAGLALTMQTAYADPDGSKDNDQGLGNEKNFGQCKKEAKNDRACEGKFGKD